MNTDETAGSLLGPKHSIHILDKGNLHQQHTA